MKSDFYFPVMNLKVGRFVFKTRKQTHTHTHTHKGEQGE